jgi:PAS domain S-box-containing protein
MSLGNKAPTTRTATTARLDWTPPPEPGDASPATAQAVGKLGRSGRGLADADLWFVDSLQVPASLHDVDGRFLRMNAAAERASGRSNSELLGGHFTDLLPAEARENVEAQFRRAVEQGEPTDFETVFVDASGHLRGVRAQHLPLQLDGAIAGVLILAFHTHRPPSIGALPRPRLTPRQHKVLELIASGLSTAEIARELSLSPETVRNHLRSVFRELQAHTRLEAIASAKRLGLLAAPALGPQPADAES